MPRMPSGRPPGRPRGDRYGTPEERVARAKTLLPSVGRFPDLLRAVDRVMQFPNQVVIRDPRNGNPQDVDLLHIYSPAERGQILAFTWWAYVNREAWTKRRKLAAVTLLSPLMLFTGTFFEEMTGGIPAKSASKWMTRPEGMVVSRVTGSCEMRIIHLLLDAAARGDDDFRLLVAALNRDEDVPQALLARLSGVPRQALGSPGRGVQFTPSGPDLVTLSVRPRDEYLSWLDSASKVERDLLPTANDQEWVRDVFAEALLTDTTFTATPVPRLGEVPYHLCIPGLSPPHRAKALGARYYERVYAWEGRYLLPSSI